MNFQEKVEKMPKDVKDFFVSNNMLIESLKSFVVSGINPELNEKIAKDIGLIFVGDVRLESLPSLVMQKTGLDNGKAYGVVWGLNKRIFSKFPNYFKNSRTLLSEWENKKITPIFSEEIVVKKLIEMVPWIKDILKQEMANKRSKSQQGKIQTQVIKIVLIQAMQKYPKVQDQIISEKLIKLNNKEYLVKGSVRNWIKDYYAVVGAGNKDIMKRSSYAYHSQNAKMLNNEEKQKLLFILKALEGNAPIAVDPNKEEIIFPMDENSNIARNFENRNARTEAPKEKLVFNKDGAMLETTQSDGQTKIKQVQGNRFNLSSNHFAGDEEKKVGIADALLENDDSVKFSSPQQFPVEKEK